VQPSSLLATLHAVVGERTFCLVTEWLGYLPFGQHSWIEVEGVDVTAQLPPFDAAELARLVAEGQLVEVEHRASNSTDSRTSYRVRLAR